MKVHNVHQRRIDAPADVIGRLLDTLSGPDDAVWPAYWPPMRFDRPLQVGAVGGHGDVRYTVDDYEPGRRVVFRFADGVGIIGTHRLEVEPHGAVTIMRHVIEGRLVGGMRLLWPVAIRAAHDAVLEDLLDKVERGATGHVRRPVSWSRYVRVLRWVFSRLERPQPDPAPAPTSAA
jgi:hypothetical protein